MAEELFISENLSKEEMYKQLLPQLKGLVNYETDLIANLSNVTAALKYTFHFLWVGFYLVKENELVLGPFQGPIACTRIKKGKGVCGTSWVEKRTIVVPNVDEFPGHIACSSSSKSEIVLPIFNHNKEVVMVLDVDSEELSTFDEVDEKYLNEVVKLIERII
ncbi:MAG: GAF domain-containing protein [Flavobacteriales bacterium]|nr:GAF domain-containing protein [Flavobacteriales bacterium]